MDAAPDLRQNAHMQNLMRPSVSPALGIAFEVGYVRRGLGEGFAVLKTAGPLYTHADAAAGGILRQLPVNTRLKIDSVTAVAGRSLYRVRVLLGRGQFPATWAYDTGSNTRGYMYLTAADLRH
jgi:hypothetical protein